MTIRILQVMTAFVLAGLTSHASAGPQFGDSVEFQLRTVKVGDNIAAVTTRGGIKFYAIVCTLTGADLLYPNRKGDINTTHYKSQPYRTSPAAEPLSKYTALDYEASVQICRNPNGIYNFKVATEGGNEVIKFVNGGPVSGADQGKLKADEEITVQTILLDQDIIAATSDGKVYGIVCNMGIINQSSADLLMQNSNATINTDHYSNPRTCVSASCEPYSKYVPLDQVAALRICNEPAGLYILKASNLSSSSKVVQYIDGVSLSANSGRRTRGF